MVELTDQGLHGVCGTVDWQVGAFGHQERKGSTVVNLTVVHNDEIELVEVNRLLKIPHKFFVVGGPDGVNQDSLLFFDQICVLTRTVGDRVIVSVESCQFPVYFPDP